MNRFLRISTSLATVFCVGSVAHGALMISDDDFQAGATTGTASTVNVANAGWFEEIGGATTPINPFAEFTRPENGSSSPNDGDDNTTDDVFVGLGSINQSANRPISGRIYQNVGAYGGEGTLTIALTAIDLGIRGWPDDMQLQLWVGGTAANAGDGNALGTDTDSTNLDINAVLHDSVTLDDSIFSHDTDSSTPGFAIVVEALEFDAGLSPLIGNPVWLALTKPTANNNTLALFDDISIVVPEPASAALLTMGVAMISVRRKTSR
ncbi:MAG: PEP-CTERM sorting domain-containing protein [Planctomycetota bacterium]